MKQKSFETMLNRLIGLTPDQVESLIATAWPPPCAGHWRGNSPRAHFWMPPIHPMGLPCARQTTP